MESEPGGHTVTQRTAPARPVRAVGAAGDGPGELLIRYGCGPVKLTGTMAFMFETRFPQRVTEYAATSGTLQDDYADCWQGLERRFDPTKP